MTSKPLIELKEVNAGYNGDIILKDVDFTIRENDFIGVIGPNGGGKTTLVKVVLGLLKPASGQVINHIKNEGNIGYLPQVNKIDNKFPITAREVVLSGLTNQKNYYLPYSKQDKNKVKLNMQNLGIDHLANKPIGELSGGQMQRVFLCRAIVSDPQLLILDEPNTYVDNQFESEMYEHLKTLNKKMAILMVSHDVGMISTYIKSIACINKALHYHPSNKITDEQLQAYNCPIQLITHGDIPHTVLHTHKH